MTISFNNIPTTLRVPFCYVEFDSSKAQQGPAIQAYKTLVVGQMLAAGTETPLTLIKITSEAQARTLFGAGSILHGMLKTYLNNDKVTELWAIAQEDDGAAVEADGSILFTGPATDDGTLKLYVAGRLISIAVTSGMTAAQVATALVAAITADSESYVSSVVNGVTPEQVDLTAKNGGELGNQIDVRFNYYESDELPAGIGATITALTGGSGNPDVDDVIAALPEDQYNVIAHCYTDASNLTKLETELDDRFGPIRQNDGVMFAANIDTLGNLATLGNSRNSKSSVIVGAIGPSAPWEWSSAWAGQVAKSAQSDPAKPLQTLPLIGILPPTASASWTFQERNNLLYDGIATHRVSDGGIVRIERSITTYKKNDAGADDTAYLDVETLFTLSYLRYSFRTRMLNKYSRHKLANDGTRFGPGQAIITPKLGKAEAVSWFAENELLGLVEGLDQFKRDLIVERNISDPNRLDFLLPPDLINQLRVIGTQIQFLL